MGPNQRHRTRPEELPDPSGSSSNKKKWSNFLPVLVCLVVIGEIAFLGRLDMAKNADLVNSWADSFYRFTKTTSSSWSTSSLTDDVGSGYSGGGGGLDDPRSEPEDSCEAWLEKEDSVSYSRDFKKDPIFVHGGDEEFKTCAVGCKFGFDSSKKPDAAFGLSQQEGTAGVLRSMESAQYYAENNIDMARRWEGISHCHDN